MSSLFLFLFYVSEGSHLFPGAISSLRSDSGLEDDPRLFPEALSTSLLDESCGGDVEDETFPDLVDNPGTTGGTKMSVCLPIFCWLLTADPLVGASVVFAKLPSDRTVFPSDCAVTNSSRS